MAVQKSKVSRARRGARRAHNALKKEALSLDPVTGEKHLRHHMTKDGFFKGRKILDIKTKDDSTEDSPSYLVSKKTVLITGASRGIGKAILESLNNEYFIVGTGTSESSVQSILENINSMNIDGNAFKLDLGDRDSIKDLTSLLDSKEIYPDILINNAGITRDNIMLRMKDDEWDNVIDVHLNGQYLLIKSFIKKMVKNRWGRIINISSTSAVLGNKGQANYAAAKAGIEAMSRSLARELGSRNINVNCVAPGFIETDMTKEISDGNEDFLASQIPLGRLGKPNEIAEVVNFLASDQANYITGQTIHVNGGLYM